MFLDSNQLLSNSELMRRALGVSPTYRRVSKALLLSIGRDIVKVDLKWGGK